MKKLILLLALFTVLSACSPETNKIKEEVPKMKLICVAPNGAKVYRYNDEGVYVYVLTTSGGETKSISTE